MVKAEEFWSFLCNELDYRFFAGIPCKGLKPLYDTMSPEFMHYIPAVNERVAAGMCNGARLAGVKSAMLIDLKNIYSIFDLIFNFNSIYKIPFLIIAYENNKINLNKIGFDVKHKYLSKTLFKPSLRKFVKVVEEDNTTGIVIIKEGVLE